MPIDKRQNPEALLQRAQAEESKNKRGKLKIYLGAAPGVGKTYQMLHDALQKREKGLDIVVGVAESHGRLEIETMLTSLEILPRQVVNYHGQRLLEFDLDSALKRAPGLILVDEMAHTNAPGLRHTKRWQDIKELLDRGMDVYTTLNVQHIESLNNDVTQIIQVPINETVPDSMLEMADTIELIDLPPEDLLKRLQEGKVFIPQQVDLAIEHFFRKGNLIALRGLALRTTAERVGAEVLMYRQGEGIKQIWPTKDKILVCVDARPEALKLIRAAKRAANRFQAEWMAVYVDRPNRSFATKERNQAIQNLRLAELLGAETHVLLGSNLVLEIMNFSHEKNVTVIMILKTIRPRWFAWLFRSLTDEIVRHSGEINVYVMSSEFATHGRRSIPTKRPTQAHGWKIYALALGIVGGVTVLNLGLAPFFTASGLMLLYLLGIIGVALLGRIGPAIVATLFSVVAYDFFFIQPAYGLNVPNIKSSLTLILMFSVAQMISQLIIVTRRQTESARIVQHQTSALYALNRQLTGTWHVNQLLEVGTRYIANAFNCEVIALLPQKGHLEISASSSAQQTLSVKELSIAEWVYGGGKMAGLGTDTLAFSKALYLPLLTSQGTIGVCRVCPETQQLLTPDQMRLLEACVNQLALALEVGRLQEKATRQEWKQESERVQSTLLQTIGQTIQAPLGNILGAAGHFMTQEGPGTESIEHDFYVEIEQLKRLNSNISQITQLESHTIHFHKTSSAVPEIINSVLTRGKKLLKDRTVHLDVSEDLPAISLNESLLDEVLMNLIDNAIKFSPAGAPIEITAFAEQHRVVVSIEDHGPGISLDEMPKLFEKFFRGKQSHDRQGLGLGLTICEKIIKAHGGTIWAENRLKGGAAFRFTLPLSDAS